MIGLTILGAIAAFVFVVWLRGRRGRPDPSGTRWDDPRQAEAHWAESLSKLRRGAGGQGP